MKKYLLSFWLLALLCLFTGQTYALETDFLPDVKEGIVSISIQDPERDVGYTVGDILTRELTVSIKKPYVLVEESLPIVGYERRYKGQLIGIDLSQLKHTKQESSDHVTHHITLSYQVFTNNVVAKPAALPAEFLRLINTSAKKDNVFRYRIPSWNFAISPLSVFGQVKVETDMSGYRGPLLLNPEKEKIRLQFLLPILALSLLGLLYIFGKHAWLPRMGGPFAQAYKTIKKSSHSDKDTQNAFIRMHESLNTSAGYSLFSNNTADFFNKKHTFKHLESELDTFFKLSRQVFFEPKISHQSNQQALEWLAVFCKQCRDCERGLIPDSAKTKR
ncbi:MAG TPA: hypothetical protein DCO68_02350 [Methylophilaceae bacterium]|nr:hypothetical protein [Methylophilaceae bacterium]HAJ70900.1 hypothetical protein [Methylophilaceae bacterium]